MGVNYKWRKAFSIPKIGFSIADRERENFPELIDCGRIARMQHPTDLHAERVLAYTLIDVCKSDALPHTAETTNKMTSPAKTVDTHRRVTLFSGAAREVYTVPAKYKDVTTYLLTAPAFTAWLAAQGEEPSEHVAAWFEAVAVAAAAPNASAPPAAPAAASSAVAVLAAAAAAPETVTTHITSRGDLLTPLVVKAQNTCDDRYDTAAVFTVLKSWAEQKTPPAPLEGLTEDGKIQWRDSNDKLQALRRSALAKRLRRQREESEKPPPVGEQLRRIK